MEARQLTAQELERLYPPSIVAWERKHGIIRYEKNGMVYVCCARPFEDVCASIDRENEQIKARLAMKERRMMP